MSSVRFRPEAEADLLSIALYIAADSPRQAEKMIARLRARCTALSSQIFLGRPRPELGEDMRGLVERPYLIVYRVIGADAEIVAIVHGARDLPSVLTARIERGE